MEERARQKCEQCCAQFVRLVLPVGQTQEMEMHKVDTSNQYHKAFCPYFGLTSPQCLKSVTPLMKPAPRHKIRDIILIYTAHRQVKDNVSLKLNFQPHWCTQKHIFS